MLSCLSPGNRYALHSDLIIYIFQIEQSFLIHKNDSFAIDRVISLKSFIITVQATSIMVC